MSDVYRRIKAVQDALSRIGLAKEQKNKDQGFLFRGIDDLLIALSPILADNGLIIIPRQISRTVIERPTRAGGVMFFVTIESEFDFISAEDGSKHTGRMFGEGQDTSDKATGKASSAAYKNMCFQAFCIPVRGTPDGDATGDDALPKQDPPPPPPEYYDEIPGFVGEDWRSVVIHVTKDFNGKSLGDIPPTKLEWLVGNYKPKKAGDKGYKAADAELRSALNAAAEELKSQ